MATLRDLQRAPGAPPDERPATLPLALARRRTFDTPEFAGMTFLEVEVRSALNRVKGMGFNWSINPYRGCSHACTYCLSGETPILMADGCTRRIADIRPGDTVYGTVRHGADRRYVVTHVLDHWSTFKPAYRILLSDGTELVASGDHRFLSTRGWKHVTGAEHGPPRRPHLTPGDWLIGTGRSSAPPTKDRGCLPLRVESIEPLGVEIPMYDLSTGTGDFIANGVVSHNCFARPSHAYLNLNPIDDFERMIVVKTNLVEVLERELARPTWRGEHVAMGTNTDPYQRCEGRYRLMPGVIRALGASLTPFSILTKGTLITRDLEALQQAATRVPVTAAFTVGMLDEALWRAAEPGTPSPRARLAAVRFLNDAGIPTGVMLAPIMPGLNDDREQLATLVDAAAAAGATQITPIVLHLRPGVREAFWPWLEREHPELVGRYRALYGGSQAAKAYREPLVAFIRQQREAAWRRHGRPDPPSTPRGDRSAYQRRPSGEPTAEQLKLL